MGVGATPRADDKLSPLAQRSGSTRWFASAVPSSCDAPNMTRPRPRFAGRRDPINRGPGVPVGGIPHAHPDRCAARSMRAPDRCAPRSMRTPPPIDRARAIHDADLKNSGAPTNETQNTDEQTSGAVTNTPLRLQGGSPSSSEMRARRPSHRGVTRPANSQSGQPMNINRAGSANARRRANFLSSCLRCESSLFIKKVKGGEQMKIKVHVRAKGSKSRG